MGWIRDFTQRHLEPVERNIDNDAPGAMRNELVDFFLIWLTKASTDRAWGRYSREESTM